MNEAAWEEQKSACWEFSIIISHHKKQLLMKQKTKVIIALAALWAIVGTATVSAKKKPETQKLADKEQALQTITIEAT